MGRLWLPVIVMFLGTPVQAQSLDAAAGVSWRWGYIRQPVAFTLRAIVEGATGPLGWEVDVAYDAAKKWDGKVWAGWQAGAGGDLWALSRGQWSVIAGGGWWRWSGAGWVKHEGELRGGLLWTSPDARSTVRVQATAQYDSTDPTLRRRGVTAQFSRLLGRRWLVLWRHSLQRAWQGHTLWYGGCDGLIGLRLRRRAGP